MTDYDFRTLSPVDFEHLTRDVLNAELGLRLQSYPAGRDQGVDLRQVIDDGKVIVAQCKHYRRSFQIPAARASHLAAFRRSPASFASTGPRPGRTRAPARSSCRPKTWCRNTAPRP